ncbi:MAG: adenine deaminase [Anaerolineaceae bacterium]|nr:adenine deaminase [Anaerolineaceae bacterium]
MRDSGNLMKSFRIKDTRALVDCAMGRRPADLAIRNATWVCVQSGEFVPNTFVGVLGERIAYVGEETDALIGPETVVIDAEGKYLVPGLIDGHMHVESGMITVTEFVRAVVPRGTTGMFIDPHEIGNVFGLDGVRLMSDEAALQPIHVFVQVPSCVPSAPGYETTGSTITAEDVEEALQWDQIIGLGEMMNYPGVFLNNEEVHQKLISTRVVQKAIGGHYPTEDLGLPFHGYVAGGVGDDHEGTRTIDAVARVRQGMWVMMRQGSAWHDVAALVKAVTEQKLDPRRFILCTDDSHSHTLVTEGHMDKVVRFAITQGLPPMTAIQMATINTAERFGVDQEMGMIAPDRFADMLIISELSEMRPEKVIAKGKIVAEKGKLCIPLPEIDYPAWTMNSVHLSSEVKADEFRVIIDSDAANVNLNVIGVIENQAPTRHLKIVVPVSDGELHANQNQDLAKIAVLDRHHDSGTIQKVFVSGFGLRETCAIASTVSHDCHQMVVVGTDDENMAIAVNRLRETQGGQVVVRNGTVIGLVELPIAGLMSNQSAEHVARSADSVLAGIRACGCELNNANMQLSLLSLVVIPALRVSDKGLFDGEKFEFLPLYEEGVEHD